MKSDKINSDRLSPIDIQEHDIFFYFSSLPVDILVLIIVSRSRPLLSNNRHPFFSGQVQQEREREPLSGNGKKICQSLLGRPPSLLRPCKIAFNEPQESARRRSCLKKGTRSQK